MRKNIFLHKRDLFVELFGDIKLNDVITLKEKIDYITTCYKVEKILIDISKVNFKNNYINIIKNKKTVFITK